MYELSINGDFASAHFLKGYEGKCKNLHGHTWKVELSVKGERLDAAGMVMDFAVLKQKLRDFLKTLDHVCLNDLPAFQDVNPTTENIAAYIYRHFAAEVAPLKVASVRVWESPTASVTYYE